MQSLDSRKLFNVFSPPLPFSSVDTSGYFVKYRHCTFKTKELQGNRFCFNKRHTKKTPTVRLVLLFFKVPVLIKGLFSTTCKGKKGKARHRQFGTVSSSTGGHFRLARSR
jgi:hypothetical protein